MNTDRGKRIRNIVVAVLIVTIGILLIGRYFYNIYDRKQEVLENNIERTNKSLSFEHDRQRDELLDIAIQVSAFKNQLSEVDKEKYLIQLEAISETAFMKSLVFTNQDGYNSSAYDYSELFDQCIERVQRIINYGLSNEESYMYLSELEIVLEELSDEFWQGYREYNSSGYGELTRREEKAYDDKRTVGIVEGEMFDRYFSGSFQKFDRLRKYDEYFSTIPWRGNSISDKVRQKYFDLDTGIEMRDLILPILFGDTVISIEDKMGEYLELGESFNEYEWEVEVAYMDEKLEYSVRIDPYEKSFDVYLEDLEDYDFDSLLTTDDAVERCIEEIGRITDEEYIVTYIDDDNERQVRVSVLPVKDNYYNQMNWISYSITSQGMLAEMSIRDIITWYGEYKGEESVSIDLSEDRLLAQLSEDMLKDYESMKVIKDYDDLIIYEVMVKNYENYLYYQLDYETFELLDVKAESVIDEDIR